MVNNGDAPAPARITRWGTLRTSEQPATNSYKGLLKQNSDPQAAPNGGGAMLRISDTDPVLAAAQSMPVESDPQLAPAR